MLEKENEKLSNEQYRERIKLKEKYENIEENKLRNNYKEKYDMKYDRMVLNNELDSKNKYIKSENEHKLNIEKLKEDYNLKSKYKKIKI